MKPASPVSAWEANWADYLVDGRTETTPQICRTLLSLGDLRNWRVLEVGCGTGGDAAVLSQAGTHVTGLYFSPKSPQLAGRTARTAGVDLYRTLADAYRLPFAGNSFDIIFHQGFLEHFHDPAPLLREQVRALKPGGYLLIDVPQRYTLYALKKFFRVHTGRWFAGWERSFSIFQLRRLAGDCGLRVVRSYGRGYSPHILHHLRYLQGIRSHRPIGSQRVRALNNRLWDQFERSLPALLYFKNIGIVCRKDADQI